MTDPGVAAERTDLAWTRTSLSFVAVALLAARLAVPGSVAKGVAVAVPPLAAAAFAYSTSARRRAGQQLALAVLAIGTVVTAVVIALV